jgi:excisionase family DNA binding protein
VAADSRVPATETSTSSNDDVYLRPDEVCAWLNVTKDWLYDVVEQKRIPFTKFGRQLRFHKGELRAWIRNNQRLHVVMPETSGVPPRSSP